MTAAIGNTVWKLLPDEFSCQFDAVLNNNRCNCLFEDDDQLDEFNEAGYSIESTDFFDHYCEFMAKVHNAANDLPRLARIVECNVVNACNELSDDMMCDHVDYLIRTNNNPIM